MCGMSKLEPPPAPPPPGRPRRGRREQGENALPAPAPAPAPAPPPPPAPAPAPAPAAKARRGERQKQRAGAAPAKPPAAAAPSARPPPPPPPQPRGKQLPLLEALVAADQTERRVLFTERLLPLVTLALEAAIPPSSAAAAAAASAAHAPAVTVTGLLLDALDDLALLHLVTSNEALQARVREADRALAVDEGTGVLANPSPSPSPSPSFRLPPPPLPLLPTPSHLPRGRGAAGAGQLRSAHGSLSPGGTPWSTRAGALSSPADAHGREMDILMGTFWAAMPLPIAAAAGRGAWGGARRGVRELLDGRGAPVGTVSLFPGGAARSKSGLTGGLAGEQIADKMLAVLLSWGPSSLASAAPGTGDLIHRLATASPAERSRAIGEELRRRVAATPHADRAGTVAGMFHDALEDWEVLPLLYLPPAVLEYRVERAVCVLESGRGRGGAGGVGGGWGGGGGGWGVGVGVGAGDRVPRS
jgi:hypothetical protein